MAARSDDRRFGSPRASWLAAAVCMALALLLGLHLEPRVRRGVETYGWDATEGVLLEAARGREYVHGIDDAYEFFWVSLRYAYSTPSPEGTLHWTGARYDVDTGSGKEAGRGFGSEGKTRFAMGRAPTVTVYYDPEDPEQSVLRRGISYGTGWWLLPCAVSAGLGVAFARVALAARRRTGAGKTHPAALPVAAGLTYLVAAPLFLGSVGTVTERWLGWLPTGEWALGLAVVGFSAIVAPGVFRVPLVKKALGLSAPPIAATVLAGMAVLVLEMAQGERRPAWSPADEHVVAWLSDPNPRVREWACRTAARADGRSELPPDRVAELVADPDPEVADAAMFLVKERRVRDPRVAAELVRKLREGSEEERRTAAWRLGGQPAADPDASLAGAFELLRGGETSQRAGLTLLTQVGRGRPEAAAAVATLVRDRGSPTRKQALWTLELMRADSDVARHAVYGVLAEGREELRRTAVHYLAEVGRPDRGVPSEALAAIVLDLGHDKPRRRQDAARALARLGSGALPARAALEQTASRDEDALTRHLAGEALAALGDG